jgi:hypothetical protein
VDQEGNSELAEMTEALENAFADLYSTSVAEPGLMHLSELADQVGLSAFIGRIGHVGQDSRGTFFVMFVVKNVDGTTDVYASRWPGWAFELAKAAFLRNIRKVLVLSNGDPVGDNLSHVLLLADFV